MLAWDLAGTNRYIPTVAELEPRAEPAGRVLVPAPSGDIGAVITGADVRLADLAHGELIATVAADPSPNFRWDPSDPTGLYTADATGRMARWTTDGELVEEWHLDLAPVVALAVTADGSGALAVSPDGEWRVIATETGRPPPSAVISTTNRRVGGI